ncbi:hypothetical protein V8C86DRAFT_3024782 [Haematococcus lacustris]
MSTSAHLACFTLFGKPARKRKKKPRSKRRNDLAPPLDVVASPLSSIGGVVAAREPLGAAHVVGAPPSLAALRLLPLLLPLLLLAPLPRCPLLPPLPRLLGQLAKGPGLLTGWLAKARRKVLHTLQHQQQQPGSGASSQAGGQQAAGQGGAGATPPTLNYKAAPGSPAWASGAGGQALAAAPLPPALDQLTPPGSQAGGSRPDCLRSWSHSFSGLSVRGHQGSADEWYGSSGSECSDVMEGEGERSGNSGSLPPPGPPAAGAGDQLGGGAGGRPGPGQGRLGLGPGTSLITRSSSLSSSATSTHSPSLVHRLLAEGRVGRRHAQIQGPGPDPALAGAAGGAPTPPSRHLWVSREVGAAAGEEPGGLGAGTEVVEGGPRRCGSLLVRSIQEGQGQQLSQAVPVFDTASALGPGSAAAPHLTHQGTPTSPPEHTAVPDPPLPGHAAPWERPAAGPTAAPAASHTSVTQGAPEEEEAAAAWLLAARRMLGSESGSRPSLDASSGGRSVTSSVVHTPSTGNQGNTVASAASNEALGSTPTSTQPGFSAAAGRLHGMRQPPSSTTGQEATGSNPGWGRVLGVAQEGEGGSGAVGPEGGLPSTPLRTERLALLEDLEEELASARPAVLAPGTSSPHLVNHVHGRHGQQQQRVDMQGGDGGGEGGRPLPGLAMSAQPTSSPFGALPDPQHLNPAQQLNPGSRRQCHPNHTATAGSGGPAGRRQRASPTAVCCASVLPLGAGAAPRELQQLPASSSPAPDPGAQPPTAAQPAAAPAAAPGQAVRPVGRGPSRRGEGRRLLALSPGAADGGGGGAGRRRGVGGGGEGARGKRPEGGSARRALRQQLALAKAQVRAASRLGSVVQQVAGSRGLGQPGWAAQEELVQVQVQGQRPGAVPSRPGWGRQGKQVGLPMAQAPSQTSIPSLTPPPVLSVSDSGQYTHSSQATDLAALSNGGLARLVFRAQLPQGLGTLDSDMHATETSRDTHTTITECVTHSSQTTTDLAALSDAGLARAVFSAQHRLTQTLTSSNSNSTAITSGPTTAEAAAEAVAAAAVASAALLSSGTASSSSKRVFELQSPARGFDADATAAPSSLPTSCPRGQGARSSSSRAGHMTVGWEVLQLGQLEQLEQLGLRCWVSGTHPPPSSVGGRGQQGLGRGGAAAGEVKGQSRLGPLSLDGQQGRASRRARLFAPLLLQGPEGCAGPLPPVITRYPHIIHLNQELRRVLLGSPSAAPLGTPPSQGRVGGDPSAALGLGAAGGSGAAGANRQDLIGEMSRRSLYAQQVAEQAEQHAGLLGIWSERLRSARFSSMGQVEALMGELEEELAVLCDESAVIKRLTEVSCGSFQWPEARCDALRWATALHAQLQAFAQGLAGWQVEEQAGLMGELQRATRFFEGVVKRADELVRDKDRIDTRFKEAAIPWSWDISRTVQRSALNLLHQYLAAVLREVSSSTLPSPKHAAGVAVLAEGAGREGQAARHGLRAAKAAALSLPGGGPAAAAAAAYAAQARVRLLDQAITFAFKVHQFVGGFDAACTEDLEQLTPLWRAARQ